MKEKRDRRKRRSYVIAASLRVLIIAAVICGFFTRKGLLSYYFSRMGLLLLHSKHKNSIKHTRKLTKKINIVRFGFSSATTAPGYCRFFHSLFSVNYLINEASSQKSKYPMHYSGSIWKKNKQIKIHPPVIIRNKQTHSHAFYSTV